MRKFKKFSLNIFKVGPGASSAIKNLLKNFQIWNFRTSKEFQDCLIVATEGKYAPKPVVWAFPKHSPYLEIFNFYLNEYTEKGFWDAIQRKHMMSPQICSDYTNESIGWSKCITAFLCLIGGICISAIIMGLEYLQIRFVSLIRITDSNVNSTTSQNPSKGRFRIKRLKHRCSYRGLWGVDNPLQTSVNPPQTFDNPASQPTSSSEQPTSKIY